MKSPSNSFRLSANKAVLDFFDGVRKYSDPSEEEGLFGWHCQTTVYHGEMEGQELRAGTWKQEHLGNCLLALSGCLTLAFSFLTQSRTTCRGCCLSQQPSCVS